MALPGESQLLLFLELACHFALASTQLPNPLFLLGSLEPPVLLRVPIPERRLVRPAQRPASNLVLEFGVPARLVPIGDFFHEE